MEYKYKDDLANLAKFKGTECFFNDYSERNTTAYRWTFIDINDKRNFIPMSLDESNYSLAKTCEGWALSFYLEETKSRSFWNSLILDKPNKYKKIGTHIAVGEILKTDGKCSNPNKHSHFNLIEYMNVNFEGRFIILDCLMSAQSN